jgi:predicted RNA-binding protein YlxR (DUF448 family)
MVLNNTPLRRCIDSGETVPTNELIRFVVGPEDELVPDIEGGLPGRGLWVTSTTPALARAVSRDLFSKTSRRRVRTPSDLIARVERLLVRQCQSRLGLARRAGVMVVGFEKVRSMIRAGDAAVLVAASDAGADGRAKLMGLGLSLAHVQILSREELSLAVGRENVVHAALARNRLAVQFVSDTKRLAGIRPENVALNSTRVVISDKSETRSLNETGL